MFSSQMCPISKSGPQSQSFFAWHPSEQASKGARKRTHYVIARSCLSAE